MSRSAPHCAFRIVWSVEMLMLWRVQTCVRCERVLSRCESVFPLHCENRIF